jgi:hypothetical protein
MGSTVPKSISARLRASTVARTDAARADSKARAQAEVDPAHRGRADSRAARKPDGVAGETKGKVQLLRSSARPSTRAAPPCSVSHTGEHNIPRAAPVLSRA